MLNEVFFTINLLSEQLFSLQELPPLSLKYEASEADKSKKSMVRF